MTGREIRAQVDVLNMEMEKVLRPNQFILNNQMIVFSKQIADLQAQCEHSYRDGICVYCDQMEE